MIPVIPLAVAGALAVFAFAMAKKEDSTVPGTTGPSPTPEPNKTPLGAQPANSASAPAGQLPTGTTPKTGDANVVHADDAFDQAVATAIANHDIAALEKLAQQAEAKGLLTVARSLRDEIARLKAAAPVPTPPGPDKVALSTALATYIVQSGDTGEKVALKFTGDKSRWRELLTVNPTLKSAQYGIALYTGHRINLPASWPSGVPVLPAAPIPALNVPPTLSSPLKTYTVVSGDTGERVAQKFTGDKTRWRELLTVNPTLKSATYGIALYTGHRINIPASWPALPTNALPAPVTSIPTAPPPLPTAPPALPSSPTALPQSDARMAAQELTSYLQSIGGLAGRYKEDQTRIKAWQSRLGAYVDGKYGKGTATIVLQNGLVPVAPYYWSRTTATSDKAAFIALVQNYAAADPQRATEWSKLIADTQRS